MENVDKRYAAEREVGVACLYLFIQYVHELPGTAVCSERGEKADDVTAST
jgi:hypothetical protein